MPKSGQLAATFVRLYPDRYVLLEKVADVAREAVQASLAPHHLDVHQVVARAKSPSSVVAKIRRKGYGNPWRQLTDQVGVRVVLYYSTDVDVAAHAIRTAFAIDAQKSIDKRQELDLQEFGYRSVHIVIQLGNRLSDTGLEQFGQLWIEVQVRSLLEHAWAEIEHEVCYKSDTDYPKAMLRRFGAVAGTLEILEQQFADLRKERDELITRYRSAYERGEELDCRLDALRLIGFLEARYREAQGWRTPGKFEPRSEVACLEAIRGCGLQTARQLGSALKRARVRAAVESYASLNGLDPRVVSHPARAILVAGVLAKDGLARYPDLTNDPSICTALGT